MLFPFDIGSGECPIKGTVDVPENIGKSAKIGDINIFYKTYAVTAEWCWLCACKVTCLGEEKIVTVQ